MKITVNDCLKLDAFEGCHVLACSTDLGRRVRTVSVLDETDLSMGVERNGIREQAHHIISILITLQCLLKEKFGCVVVVMVHTVNGDISIHSIWITHGQVYGWAQTGHILLR